MEDNGWYKARRFQLATRFLDLRARGAENREGPQVENRCHAVDDWID